jgi:hypothetical protein
MMDRVPTEGLKDVMRHPERCHIWWIDGLWSELYAVIWESTVGMDVISHLSVGSSLQGQPHRVLALKL